MVFWCVFVGVYLLARKGGDPMLTRILGCLGWLLLAFVVAATS